MMSIKLNLCVAIAFKLWKSLHTSNVHHIDKSIEATTKKEKKKKKKHTYTKKKRWKKK